MTHHPAAAFAGGDLACADLAQRHRRELHLLVLGCPHVACRVSDAGPTVGEFYRMNV